MGIRLVGSREKPVPRRWGLCPDRVLRRGRRPFNAHNPLTQGRLSPTRLSLTGTDPNGGATPGEARAPRRRAKTLFVMLCQILRVMDS